MKMILKFVIVIVVVIVYRLSVFTNINIHSNRINIITTIVTISTTMYYRRATTDFYRPTMSYKL